MNLIIIGSEIRERTNEKMRSPLALDE